MEEVKRRTAETLVARIAVAGSEPDAVEAAVCEIRLLSKTDPDARPPLADAGAVPHLVRHLAAHPSPHCRENAAAALLNISIHSREALMSVPDTLDALSQTLRRPPTPDTAQHAAATLYSLLSVEAYRPLIGSRAEIVGALISILSSPSPPTRSLKDALKALFGVSLHPPNRPLMVRLRAVPALFSLVIGDGRTGIVEDATAVIAQVAGCEESVAAFRGVSGVGVLVDLMDPVGAEWASARARENAAAALVNLARCGGEGAAEDIREVEEAAVVGAAGLVAAGGNGRGRAKGEALMRFLREWRETDRKRLQQLRCAAADSSEPCIRSSPAAGLH